MKIIPYGYVFLTKSYITSRENKAVPTSGGRSNFSVYDDKQKTMPKQSLSMKDFFVKSQILS